MRMPELHSTFEIMNALGLHARAAALLARTAARYEADIALELAGRRANAKSVLALLMLGAPQGARVSVAVKGNDARDALHEISRLFLAGFGETGKQEGLGAFASNDQALQQTA